MSNIVVYNNNIADYGDPSPTGTDDVGIYNGYHTENVWVVDNEVTNVGADGVAGSHYSNDTTMKTERYFIGRNKLYQNGENGIDIKAIRYLVISENEIFGPFTREQGWGIVLHSGASPAFPTRDCWVINNKIYHGSGGIYVTSANGALNISMVGNLIYDVKADYGFVKDPLNVKAILYRSQWQGTAMVVNNTCYDYESGIVMDAVLDSNTVFIHGNILSGRSDPAGYDLSIPRNLDEIRVTSNFNHYDASPRFRFAGNDRNISFLRGAGKELNAVLGSPGFVNAPADFSLLSTSACVGANVEGPVGNSAFEAFTAVFGTQIRRDFLGRTRPLDGSWDMGAFEFTPPNRPAAPRNLRVVGP